MTRQPRTALGCHNAPLDLREREPCALRRDHEVAPEEQLDAAAVRADPVHRRHERLARARGGRAAAPGHRAEAVRGEQNPRGVVAPAAREAALPSVFADMSERCEARRRSGRGRNSGATRTLSGRRLPVVKL